MQLRHQFYQSRVYQWLHLDHSRFELMYEVSLVRVVPPGLLNFVRSWAPSMCFDRRLCLGLDPLEQTVSAIFINAQLNLQLLK